MKVLHLSKTSSGARWASAQARYLTSRRVEVHVVLPDFDGAVAQEWMANGALLNQMDYALAPLRWAATRRSIDQLRRITDRVKPDLIHTHSVIAAMLSRLALRDRPIPRIFGVPGPIHMEKFLFRTAELATATKADHWIAMSRATMSLYRNAGINQERVFLSYPGTENAGLRRVRTGWLRRHCGIDSAQYVVGNISYIYPRKWYLLQRVGLKRHEDLIDAISLAAEADRSIRGVLIGGPWGPSSDYFDHLREYARKRSRGAVLMPGYFNREQVSESISDFDCVAHVPTSENCGGVVEPLLCGVPTIASRVGGLTEVVMDGYTGLTVPPRDPAALAAAILKVKHSYSTACAQAEAGRSLVQTMFDINRTAPEVYEIYRYVLGVRTARPDEFDSREFVRGVASGGVVSDHHG